MSGQSDSGSSIQLHFCQRCGISIPVTDVDTGRAIAAPGGYLCVGCVYQDRDHAIQPEAAGAPSERSASPRRLLVSIALLYLVGVTTFLLVREMNRKPPELVLPAPVATARDVGLLARKIDAIDEQARKAMAQLKSNDNRQRDEIRKLTSGLNRVTNSLEGHVAIVQAQHQDLVDSIVEIGERTIGFEHSARDLLRRMREADRNRGAAGPGPGPPTTDPPATTKKDGATDEAPKANPPPPAVDPERRKLIDKFIKQLLDRNIDKPTRFNAAVQLGDLMAPSSLDALVTALKKDSYDLVRRAAAYSLGMLGKHAVRAIPDLIQQMDDKEEYVGYMCARALGDITKVVMGAAVSFHFDPTQSARVRRQVQQKWEAWWQKNKAALMPE